MTEKNLTAAQLAEMWRPVPSEENLWVSTEGEAGRLKPDGAMCLLTASPNSHGYFWVRLGHKRQRKLHHLVLEAFRGPRPHPHYQGRHLDDVKANNRLDNLAWGTRAENMQDRILNGHTPRGRKHRSCILTEAQVSEIRASDEGSRVLSERYGVTGSTIRSIWNGKTWCWLLSDARKKKETCGPLYQKQLDCYVNGDPKKVEPFAAGFVSGQAEKVYLGACRAAMFRPSKDWFVLVERIARQVGQTYRLSTHVLNDEIWLVHPDRGLSLFKKLTATPVNSELWHVLRGILTGVSVGEIDYSFHERRGYAEQCDAVNDQPMTSAARKARGE